jgi:enoyl-CoA hydratase/carnithine racemase
MRNALDVTMRDRLVELFTLVTDDPSITTVELAGAGRSFSVGGDLSEFGTMGDPVTGHRIRLARSVPAALARCAPRVTARVHGLVIGSGLELAALCGRVVATPTARFGLPEVAMGLIPGSGGTLSIPARIGRERTAYLALSNRRLDATTALDWGLIDVITAAPTGGAGGAGDLPSPT